MRIDKQRLGLGKQSELYCTEHMQFSIDNVFYLKQAAMPPSQRI
jgi:hypothetical protein